jgi:signal recognition particle subunit SRP54
MFESLTDKLQGIFARIRGASRLDEKTVDEVLREIRLALLEADVNFRVVKDFIARIREQAIGEEVLKSLTPDQQVIRIVRDELTRVVGGRGGADTLGEHARRRCLCSAACKARARRRLARSSHAGRNRRGRNPLLAACDLQRPRRY